MWLVLALLAACGGGQQADTDAVAFARPGEDVVARFGSIEVKAADLDAYALGLAADARPAPGADLDAWYRDRISDYVIDQELLRAARTTPPGGEARLARARREARAQFEIELCLRDRMAEMAPFTKADLEKEFADQRANFHKVERRLTLNIFRRLAPGTDPQVAIAELSGYRDRVLGGDNFSRLAREHSDSESRHRNGELGWLARGELPPSFDAVVFTLDEGVPSQPMVTPDGVHLFFVQSISPERDATIAEAMPVLRERLQARRIDEVVRPLAEQDTRDFGMPDQAAFAELIGNGDAEAVLLHDGDYQLKLGEFRQRLNQIQGKAEAGAQRASVPVAAAWNFLNSLRARERFRAVCARNGWIPDTELDERLDGWERRFLVDAQRKQALLELAAQDEARLRQYFTQNVEQFSTPLRWNLRRLRLAQSADSSRVFARLEAAAKDSGASLQKLRAQLGGEIDELRDQNLADLRSILPSLPVLIAPLTPGRLSAPIRTREDLQIFELVDKVESTAPEFEAVRAQVASTYAAHHAADLYKVYSAALFAKQALEVFPEALSRLVDAGLPEPDITVEQLDQLMEELGTE